MKSRIHTDGEKLLLVTLVSVVAISSVGWGRTVLEGPLEDCCCEAATIDEHALSLVDALESLVKESAYFRIFLVDLNRRCPYWADDGTCVNRNCAVCPSEDREVPAVLRDNDQKECRENRSKVADRLKDVDFSMSGLMKQSMSSSAFSVDDMSVWTIQDDLDSMVYVDLVKNPERFTGYSVRTLPAPRSLASRS